MRKVIIGLIVTATIMLGDIFILHSSNDGKTDPVNVQYINQLQEICDNNGIKVKFKPTPWKRALRMLEKGKADGVMNASYKKDRAIFAVYPTIKGMLDYSRRLNDGQSYYIYKNRKSTIKWDGVKFTDVDGAVGAVTNFAVIEDLKKHPNIKIEIQSKKSRDGTNMEWIKKVTRNYNV